MTEQVRSYVQYDSLISLDYLLRIIVCEIPQDSLHVDFDSIRISIKNGVSWQATLGENTSHNLALFQKSKYAVTSLYVIKQ